MLEQLSIDQFAIIKQSTINFQTGLNILSGETGAGKSILIDALGLILGQRADAAAIRYGQDKAIINAVFSNLNDRIANYLLAEEFEDSDCPQNAIIRRIIRANGSKAYVNDQQLTGTKLKVIAAQLVSVHGQHSNQALLKTEEQRRRLDRFGKLQTELSATQEAFARWQMLEKRWQDWQERRKAHEERLNLLAYQLEELTSIAPKQDEFKMLSQQQSLLASADELLSRGNTLSQLLHDGEPALIDQLKLAQREAEQLANTASNFTEMAELLEQSSVYLSESYDALVKELGRIEHNPEQLNIVETRMSALHSLARKHHTTPENLYQLWQQIAQEHQSLLDGRQDSDALEREAEKALQIYQQKAALLTKARKIAAKELAKEVEKQIRQLGMAKAVFNIEISRAERPASHGQDDITYVLCANPGQSLQPLAKVASGGELSRISLAIEVACLDEDPVPTVIFDEIDTGIGGEVADTIGRLLHELGKTRQVLCITHLPQVAAYADAHFRIEKSSDEHETQTQVFPLTEQERIIELARMLGSAESESSQELARTMLRKRKK